MHPPPRACGLTRLTRENSLPNVRSAGFALGRGNCGSSWGCRETEVGRGAGRSWKGSSHLQFSQHSVVVNGQLRVSHSHRHALCPAARPCGIIAVFESHRAKGIPDMYSLHSWCGMATFVLYLLQWFLGCGFFLFPGASFSLRGWYKPQHIFFGITLFILSITSCLLGITEMLLFNISDSYSHFVPEGILANTLGVLLVAFGLVVGYVLTREEWKRPPLAEELALSMDFKTLTEGESPGGGSQ
uniref:Transmembrane ascorbate-dependent reductase CYB561 n=1 Tax=Junco hyemalis TaxID=40217 RepID=A0A8C5ISC9_JUNHY